MADSDCCSHDKQEMCWWWSRDVAAVFPSALLRSLLVSCRNLCTVVVQDVCICIPFSIAVVVRVSCAQQEFEFVRALWRKPS